MLPTKFYLLNHLSTSIGAKLAFFPGIVDTNTKEIIRTDTGTRRKLWKTYGALATFRGAYSGWKLFQASVWPELYFDPVTFPFHFSTFGAYLLTLFSHYIIFLHVDAAMAIYNYLLEETEEEAKRKVNWGEISIQELACLSLPVYWPLVPQIMYAMVVSLFPHSPLFPYSSLDPGFQNIFTFLLILLYDMFFITLTLWTWCFFGFVDVLFFEKCNDEMDKGTLRLKEQTAKKKLTPMHLILFYWRCRRLQLRIQYYNETCRICIFCYKNCFLLFGIVNIAFAVILFQDHLFYCLVYGFIGVLAPLLFNILFKRAFAIPVGVNKCRNMVMVAAKRFANPKHICLRMKSIPLLGIRVGSFYKFTKLSFPNFVSFLIKQVVRILVASRK